MIEGWVIEQKIVDKCGIPSAFVYCVLKERFLSGCKFESSIPQIIEAIPYTQPKTVRRALRLLEQNNFIKRSQPIKKQPYFYEVLNV